MLEIRIDGADRLYKQLDSLNVDEALNKGLRISMIGLENNVKRNTPVDTGLLRNSFETTFPSKLQGVLNNFRNYAIYVQEGTRYQKAQDFLGKGVKATERFIDRTFNKQIDLLLNNIK